MGAFNQLFQALTISLLAHLVAVLLLERTVQSPLPPDLAPVEVEFVDSELPKGKKQFVTDTEAGEVVANANTQAKFVSQDNRRVREETIATLSGPTKNSSMAQESKGATSETKGETQSRADKVLKSEVLSLKNLMPDGEVAIRNENSQNRQFNEAMARMTIDDSTISEYIPGVKTGKITALNTDQITYYTFFSRINEQLRNRWTGNIRQVSSVRSKNQIRQWSLRTRTTELEIVLDREGRFIKSRLFKASGVPDLDWAALDAFKDSAPFTNPPIELVGDDGLVRLQYSFFVEWQSIN